MTFIDSKFSAAPGFVQRPIKPSKLDLSRPGWACMSALKFRPGASICMIRGKPACT
ncbi:hypothetical protein [Caballeronia insecticola]|nr:hypothetical protein [Caballeronia insecticola]